MTFVKGKREMRRAVWAVVYCLFFCVVFSNLAFATNKTAKVCNQTGQRIFIAFGWIDGVLPESAGWYVVADGTCKRFPLPDSDTITPIYAYAKGDNGTEYIPSRSTINFCIERVNAFNNSNATCEAIELGTQSVTGKEAHLFQWQAFGAMDYETLEDHSWTIQ